MNRVLFYVPNLIGYGRIITAIWAYYVAFSNPTWFLVLYTVSFVADAADGIAARALNQCSRFGAVLDMVTDRAGTSGLVLIVSHLLRSYRPDEAELIAFAGALLVGLDIVSHFARMYKGLALGEKSHKDGKSMFWFLDMYYGKRSVMAPLCVGQEFFYLALYVVAQASHPQAGVLATAAPYLHGPVLAVLGVLCGLKQVTNVMQFVDSMSLIADDDLKAEKSKSK